MAKKQMKRSEKDSAPAEHHPESLGPATVIRHGSGKEIKQYPAKLRRHGTDRERNLNPEE